MARRVPGGSPAHFRKSTSGGSKDALLQRAGGSQGKLLVMQKKSSSRSLKGKASRQSSGGNSSGGGGGGGGWAQGDPAHAADLAEAIQAQSQQAVSPVRSRGGLHPAVSGLPVAKYEAGRGSPVPPRDGTPRGGGAGLLGGKGGSGDSLWDKAAASSSARKLPEGDAMRASVPCDKCSAATPWKLKMPCGRRVPLCPPCTSAFLAVYQDHVTKSKTAQAAHLAPRQTVEPVRHPPDAPPLAAQSGWTSQRAARAPPVQAQASSRGVLDGPARGRQSSKVLTRISQSGDAYGASRGRLSLPVL